jgi:NDP-sugar pyrophosphorylase family protein
LNIVMPMAGRGSRFVDVGQRVPKPMIDVKGKPMYAWAMDGLPLSLARRVIFICLEEHLRGFGLEEDIRLRYAHLNPVIVPISKVTEGQACTVLEAREHIDCQEPLIIYNADTYCRTGLVRSLANLPKSVAGVLGVFEAPGDKWSFARTDADGRVLEVAEKRRISNLASTGLYYFRSGAQFVSEADAMIAANQRVNNEFYVAPVYNRMIARGDEVRVDVADEVWVLGTPEDLAHFHGNHRGNAQ